MMRTANWRHALAVATSLAASWGQPRAALARYATQIIAVEGQSVPTGTGAMRTHARPGLAPNGSVAWVSVLVNTGSAATDSGILRFTGTPATGEQSLAFAARESHPSVDADGRSDANGLLGDLRYAPYLQGPDGSLAFPAALVNTVGGGFDDSGLYLFQHDQLRRIARENELTPGGDARFDAFGEYSLSQRRLALGPGDSAIFWQDLRSTTGTRFFRQAIYRWDAGRLQLVTQEGDAPPSHDGVVSELGTVHLDAQGRAMFALTARNTTMTQRVYREQHVLAAVGQTPLGSDASLGEINDILYNARGSAALDVEFGNAFGVDGVVLATGDQPRQVTREGLAPPEGNGQFGNRFELLSFNNRDEVLFQADLRNSQFGQTDDQGLYLGSAAGVRTIARENQLAPQGDGGRFDFTGLSSPIVQLSDAGTVAFLANLRATPGDVTGVDDDRGLFVHDGIELKSILRESQTLASTGEYVTEVGDFTVDDWGRVAFLARTSAENPNAISGPWGIYRYERGSIVEVLREGDTVDGFPIARITDLRGNGRGQLTAALATATNGGLSGLLLATPSGERAADFDGDDRITAADFALWSAHFGECCTATPALLDDDGAIDGRDLLRWQRQFGADAASAASQPLPEPSGMVLAFGLALASLNCPRNRPWRGR